MNRETDRLSEMIGNMARGQDARHKFVVNLDKKKLASRPVENHDPDRDVVVTAEDATLYSLFDDHSTTILVSGEIVEEMVKTGGESGFFLFAGMMVTFLA